MARNDGRNTENNNVTVIQVSEKKFGNECPDFEKPFDEDFWLKVENKFNRRQGMSWNRAMDEVRTERLLATHGKDTLCVIIKHWPASEKYRGKLELVASLEYLISRFTEIILERDKAEEYRYYRVEEDPSRPTLLHLAVEQNFLRVATLLVEKYPLLLYIKTEKVGHNLAYLPVEKALMSYSDEAAAYLISKMKPNRVHKLFLFDDTLKKEAKFSFAHFIAHKNPETGNHDMKKTVLAVLDRSVKPHWPYLQQKLQDFHLGEMSDHFERVCNSVPDDPINYYFWYHVLEADELGRQPKIGKHFINEMFNLKSLSCLQQIAESEDKDKEVCTCNQHDDRLVSNRQTNEMKIVKAVCFTTAVFIGSKVIVGDGSLNFQAGLYVVFLLVLSYGLIYGSTQENPMQYRDTANVVRLICEILSIIFLIFYLVTDINQAIREWRTHFKDLYNYFDFLGLVLTILVIPLRFVEVNSQWSVAGLGYLLNFLRLFKFSSLSSTTGLYTRTLAKVIYRDMSRFSVVFVIVFLGFCGALFMALKALDKQDMYLNYSWLMLAAVRALVEQQPVEEDYSKLNWLAILIILAYMAMVIVILLNVLIAQLSYTYSEAKNNAKLQYAIDKIVIVTRIEYSRFARFNLRVKYYLEGESVSEGTLAEEILEYSDEQNPWESAEDKLAHIRHLMRKVVRKVLYCG